MRGRYDKGMDIMVEDCDERDGYGCVSGGWDSKGKKGRDNKEGKGSSASKLNGACERCSFMPTSYRGTHEIDSSIISRRMIYSSVFYILLLLGRAYNTYIRFQSSLEHRAMSNEQ